ncbi:MAG: hypothetical protein ACI4Q3_02955 [Kiritimatiellia bacterium]
MMSEEKKSLPRGVIVDFDFTALDGAQLLFDVAKRQLAAAGIDLTIKLEALHLAGNNYQGGLNELAQKLGVDLDAAAAARELAAAFNAALVENIAAAATPGFKAFVKALTDQGLKVVVASRAGADALAPALEGLDPELVIPYSEPSPTYGNGKWDAWRRACNANGLVNLLTVGVTGSGKGVKAVLWAGLSALAIIHPHAAYQDFGGADVTAEGFSAALANDVLRMLHLK